MPESHPVRCSVIPSFRYRDSPAAIEWLCTVLGFERHAVYPGAENSIEHAELTLGGCMIMLGSPRDNQYQHLLKQPDEIGNAVTGGTYLLLTNAEATVVYARVLASGVDIPIPIEDKPYGGLGFTCRDPEGHLWSIGTYDPWQAEAL